MGYTLHHTLSSLDGKQEACTKEAWEAARYTPAQDYRSTFSDVSASFIHQLFIKGENEIDRVLMSVLSRSLHRRIVKVPPGT